jgi:hypothetical protein
MLGLGPSDHTVGRWERCGGSMWIMRRCGCCVSGRHGRQNINWERCSDSMLMRWR